MWHGWLAQPWKTVVGLPPVESLWVERPRLGKPAVPHRGAGAKHAPRVARAAFHLACFVKFSR
jgi:hypothetical protein